MTTNSEEETQSVKPGLQLEYNALRSEILKRIDMRQQLTSLTLSIAGLFLSFGLTNVGIAFIFPPIAFLLATAWAQNEIRVRQLGTYIHERIEPKIEGLGWETYRIQRRPESRWGKLPLVGLSPGGTFLITQLIAIGIGLAKFTSTPLEWGLLGIDVVAVLLILWLFYYVQHKRIK